MVNAFFMLAGAQLAGEILRALFHLPLPGPVIGMLILAAVLITRKKKDQKDEMDDASPLVHVAGGLVSNMGLLFVPAGVGIMSEVNVVQQYWLPILCGLVLSTLLGLLVTAAVMHHTLARAKPNNHEGNTR